MRVNVFARCGVADHLADIFAVLHDRVTGLEIGQGNFVTDGNVVLGG